MPRPIPPQNLMNIQSNVLSNLVIQSNKPTEHTRSCVYTLIYTVHTPPTADSNCTFTAWFVEVSNEMVESVIAVYLTTDYWIVYKYFFRRNLAVSFIVHLPSCFSWITVIWYATFTGLFLLDTATQMLQMQYLRNAFQFCYICYIWLFSRVVKSDPTEPHHNKRKCSLY